MALDPKDQVLMRDAFYDALDKWSGKKGNSFGGGGGGGGASAGGSKIPGAETAGKVFDNVGKTLSGLGTAAIGLSGKLINGGMTVTEATRTLESGLKMAGGAGSGLATALGKGVGAFGDIVQYVEEGVDVFRDLSKTGATFGNSVVDMRAAAAGSRMSMREFSDVIKENGANLSALGGKAGEGAVAFAKLSKGFFDSGLGDRLTQLGYTSEDLNKLMAVQLTNVSARELKERGGAEAQYQSTVRLAEEMDMMAKLTGVSRKEQEKALSDSKASGQVQAAIQLEMLGTNKKAGEAFEAVVGSTSGQFGKLVQEMVSSGRPLTEGNKQYVGMLSKETQAAIQEARDAYKRGDVEGAREAAKRAQALESVEAATNKSRLSLASQGVKAFEESTKEGIKYGKLLADKAKELGTDEKDPKAIAAAQKALEAEAKKAQDARSGETASVIEAQNRIKDMGSAIQESILVPLKDKANKEALNDFYKSLKNANQSVAKGGTATSDKGFAGDMSAGIEKVTDKISKNLERGSKTTGPDQKFSDDASKTANKTQVDALQKALNTSTRAPGADTGDIRTLGKSLKAVDGEAVSKQLEKIAKDQGKSSADVLKEAVNKPGGVGNLNKQLGQDPAAKKVLDDAAAASKKQQGAGDLTKASEQKGRDTSGTGNEALAKGLKAGLDSLGSLVTKSIDVFTVEGDVKINTAKLPGAAEGGVLKGPDSGYLAMLHGEETVIPNKDIDAVISGAISKLPMPPPPDQDSRNEKFKTIYDSMKSMSPTSRGNPTGGMDGFDLSSISKDISTTISSVSGGGSTTTKQVQSDDSKDAEKELKSVREQYAVEREALLQKTKEQLGPDSGSKKIRNTMRDGEEGKALEEKYKALTDPLYKKIEDGIKWEIETKDAALNETKKIMDEELSILTENGKLALALLDQQSQDTLAAQGIVMPDKPVKNSVVSPAMPSSFNEIRTSTADMQAQFDKEKTEKKKTADAAAKAAEEKKNAPKADPKADPKAAPAASKAATLDDVVSALNHLNKNMSQLLTQSESLGKKQIKASKSGSGNLYA